MVLTSAWWRFLENYVYSVPEPTPRVRTKPLQVLCVGPPRSATESLAAGLQRLGYDYVYHGWDIIFDIPCPARGWSRLARRKWLNDAPGLPITAADFDKIVGHAEALVDQPASCFAAELIEAYPETKVILNTRRDRDAWLQSMDATILDVPRGFTGWMAYIISWCDATCWWIWHAEERLLWPGFFRCLDSRQSFPDATLAQGKSIYEEHCNMVRGMVPRGRLLEWSVEDGWKPLCEFLGKEVPNEPFPHVNTKSKGYREREERWTQDLLVPTIRKTLFRAAFIIGSVVAVYAMGCRKG